MKNTVPSLGATVVGLETLRSQHLSTLVQHIYKHRALYLHGFRLHVPTTLAAIGSQNHIITPFDLWKCCNATSPASLSALSKPSTSATRCNCSAFFLLVHSIYAVGVHIFTLSPQTRSASLHAGTSGQAAYVCPSQTPTYRAPMTAELCRGILSFR